MKYPDTAIIGQAMRHFRKQRGSRITLKQAGEHISLSESTMSQLEHGYGAWFDERINALLSLYGVTRSEYESLIRKIAKDRTGVYDESSDSSTPTMREIQSLHTRLLDEMPLKQYANELRKILDRNGINADRSA